MLDVVSLQHCSQSHLCLHGRAVAIFPPLFRRANTGFPLFFRAREHGFPAPFSGTRAQFSRSFPSALCFSNLTTVQGMKSSEWIHYGSNITEARYCFPNGYSFCHACNTDLASARCANMLPYFATDVQHRGTQCCRHNASSFCQGLSWVIWTMLCCIRTLLNELYDGCVFFPCVKNAVGKHRGKHWPRLIRWFPADQAHVTSKA